MKRLLLLLLLPACACAAAATPDSEPYCKPLPFDEEVPPGLIGKYEIVGKDEATGRTYSGALAIAVVNGAYALTRTVKGRTLKGKAWVESCSPDKFQILRVRYDSKPKPIDFLCHLRFDGDNFIRTSCTTFDGRGLEAWYQNH